jgi:hypothetical protein
VQLGLDRVEDFEKLDEAAEVRTYPFASYPSTTPTHSIHTRGDSCDTCYSTSLYSDSMRPSDPRKCTRVTDNQLSVYQARYTHHNLYLLLYGPL